MSAPAIFLDRDGVIIENRPEYVRSWQDVAALPGSLATLARLAPGPYRLVLVTNQAGIGRGLIPPETAAEINRRLVALVQANGGRIDAVYVCPHRADEGCACRKPRPGMLLQAARDLGLDLPASILIGDSLTDIQAGLAAGVGRVALVRTGLGAQQEAQLPNTALAAIPVFDTLEKAIAGLLPEA